jgi:hypothetical protein
MFIKHQRMWEENDSCKRLLSAVNSIPSSTTVGKIIAFACGSLEYDSVLPFPRVSFMHALALTLRNAFQQNNLENVACYAQDPIYNEIDKLILGEFGIKVLDPDGFVTTDDLSVVLSFAPEAPIKQIIADLAKPAVIIWDRIYECDDIQSW